MVNLDADDRLTLWDDAADQREAGRTESE